MKVKSKVNHLKITWSATYNTKRNVLGLAELIMVKAGNLKEYSVPALIISSQQLVQMSWIPKIYRDKKLSAPLKASFIIVLLSIVSAGHALHVKINEYLVTIKGN